MSHRNLKYLNDNRIIYRRYSSDIPTTSFSWGWYYKDGTHGYYAMFNSKAKITSIRSLSISGFKYHKVSKCHLKIL